MTCNRCKCIALILDMLNLLEANDYGRGESQQLHPLG